MSRYPYNDHSGAGHSRDYVNQYNRNDPYKRNDDLYRRNDDLYRKNDGMRNDYPQRHNDDHFRQNDPYSNRGDPYGPDRHSKGFGDDPYNRRNHDRYAASKPSGDGFRTDSYKSSVDSGGFNNFGRPEPAIYEVDHLVTFDVSPKLGVKNHEDGMERLKHMKMTSGVWAMRYLLSVDDREIVITEKATHKELESFPISRVVEPVNITTSDQHEVYNNIIIFIVQSESSRTASEMHIFQCIGKPGQELIDDIEAARVGKFPRPPKEKRLSVSSQETDRRPVNNSRPPVNGRPPSSASNSTLPENTEADIAMLNRCFDNIESFVASLQQAANAQKKLDHTRSMGAADPNEIQFLSDKARPPPAREFIDTFQKFKLALNLLPKLKHSLKEPSAAELTHMLFSPLSLVVEASRDQQGSPKLASSVTAPLLNRDTCILLDTTLHASEIDLWRSLGDAWNIPAEAWPGPIPPPYVPRFLDNTKPERLQDPPPQNNPQRNNVMPNGAGGSGIQNPPPQSTTPAKPPEAQVPADEPMSSAAISPEQEKYCRDLKARGVKVCRIKQDRVSKNPKELSVSAGEFVEVLDDAKKWWKVSNINNDSGFVPSTILVTV